MPRKKYYPQRFEAQKTKRGARNLSHYPSKPQAVPPIGTPVIKLYLFA
jgi:hypothetical protein